MLKHLVKAKNIFHTSFNQRGPIKIQFATEAAMYRHNMNAALVVQVVFVDVN